MPNMCFACFSIQGCVPFQLKEIKVANQWAILLALDNPDADMH